ncbi:uncharacterized protein LOC121427702 [Lytechinus variegatus]|uniref:uncharacterized protein LOC121427702 n=1 Tax=Lytechinus variegatus TaxID=7654 RepID=UPI001BB26679|nr:uncharacterized protein LOC121427702 [Lytechinus variegatus]
MTTPNVTSTPESILSPVSPSIAPVSIKLPPFWANDPEIWFVQVEAQFHTKGITAEITKFNYVVASLQQEVVMEVRDIITAIPADNPYQKLKAALVKRTTVSEQTRLNRLLSGEELGDKSPSQLLRRMQLLMGTSTMEDSIFRQLFLQRLPTNVQVILAASSDGVSLVDLAALSDKIVEVAGPTSISNIQSKLAPSQPPPLPAHETKVDQLSAQVAQLTMQVQALTCSLLDNRGRGRSRQRKSKDSNKRPQSVSRSPNRSEQHAGAQCWYHWKHGSSAQKCISPCSFSAGHAQGNGPAKE